MAIITWNFSIVSKDRTILKYSFTCTQVGRISLREEVHNAASDMSDYSFKAVSWRPFINKKLLWDSLCMWKLSECGNGAS